jgi:hypothetical protein
MTSNISDQPNQEAEDLAILHEETNRFRKYAFEAMKEALRMSPEELRHSGYKSQEAAAIGSYKFFAKEIEKRTIAHLKKYPD